MALSYEERANLTDIPEFQKRVHVATLQAAVNVQGESTSGMSVTKAQKRAQVAYRVIQLDPALLKQFVWIVAVSAALTDPSTATDGDLFSAVNAAWDDVAGVTAAD